MYSATLLINDLTVVVWGETLDEISRVYVAGEVTADIFNTEFYEQIKKGFQAEAIIVPF